MISLWIGLNLMDLTITLIALEMGYTEGNLLIRGLGVIGFIVYKFILIVAVLLLLAELKKVQLLKWFCFGMGLMVIWNLGWIIIGG